MASRGPPQLPLAPPPIAGTPPRSPPPGANLAHPLAPAPLQSPPTAAAACARSPGGPPVVPLSRPAVNCVPPNCAPPGGRITPLPTAGASAPMPCAGGSGPPSVPLARPPIAGFGSNGASSGGMMPPQPTVTAGTPPQGASPVSTSYSTGGGGAPNRPAAPHCPAVDPQSPLVGSGSGVSGNRSAKSSGAGAPGRGSFTDMVGMLTPRSAVAFQRSGTHGLPRFMPQGWGMERRRTLLQSELHEAPPEPAVSSLDDLAAWQAWARDMLIRVQAHTHPRVRADDGSVQLLPIWGTSAKEMGRVFGAGLRLYLDLLKFLWGFFVLGLLCALPSLLLNSYGGPGETRTFAERVTHFSDEQGIFLFPQGYFYATSIATRIGCESAHCQEVSLQTTILDGVFTLLLLWGISDFSRRISTLERDIDLEITSISDYSLQLSGYPPDVTPEDVRQHVERVIEERVRAQLATLTPAVVATRQGRYAAQYYEDLLAGRKWAVFEVVPLLDNYSLLKAGVDKAPLEAETEFLARKLQRLQLLGPLRERTALGAFLHRLEARHVERRITALQEKVRVCRREIAEAITGRKHSTVSIIVSFHFEAGRIEALAAFSNDPVRRALGALGCCGDGVADGVDARYAPPASAAQQHAPRTVEAIELPEPADLILENFAFEGSWDNVWRRRLADLAVLVLLFSAFLFFFFAEVESNRAEETGAVREVGSSAFFISTWASLIAVVANTILRELMSRVIALERHTLRSDVQHAIALKMTVAQIANMALIPPLVSSAVPEWLPVRGCTSSEDACPPDGVCCLFGPKGLLFRGDESDLSSNWFSNTGAQIMLTMAVQLLVSLGGPIALTVLTALRQRFEARRAVTLDGLVRIHHGEQFEIADRYGELLAYAAVVLIYAPGMPLLYVFGIAFCTGVYWLDKYALLRRHPHPPPYDTKLAELAQQLMPPFVLAHCLFALRAYSLTPGAGFALNVDTGFIDPRLVDTTAAQSGAGFSIDEARARAERVFLITSITLVVCALLFGRVPVILARSLRSIWQDYWRPWRVTAKLEYNPRLVDAIAGCEHPGLRRLPGGQLVTPTDVGRNPLSDTYELFSPMSWFFRLLGIHLARPTVSIDGYNGAAHVRVHLDESHGQQSTYSPEKNPFYKAAFQYDARGRSGVGSGMVREGNASPDVTSRNARAADPAHPGVSGPPRQVPDDAWIRSRVPSDAEELPAADGDGRAAA